MSEIEIKPDRVYVTEDGSGDFELELRDEPNGPNDYTFLNREQADKLIVALGGIPKKRGSLAWQPTPKVKTPL